MNEKASTIDLGLIHHLLDCDDEIDIETNYGIRRIVRKARERSLVLPQLVLSMAEHAGVSLGTGSSDELRRARAKVQDYVDLHSKITATTEAYVLKGPSLSARYPEGVMRSYADLDLVVADEFALWQAVRIITELRPVDYVEFSEVGAARNAVAVVTWEAADPLMDNDHGIEIYTAAYLGDGAVVPVRAQLPSDPWTADLLALAEERFQRAFFAKDALDVLALAHSGPPSLPEVASSVKDFLLAPEVLELLTYTGDRASLGPLDELAGLLRPAAAAESTRRKAVTVPPDGTTVEERRAAGQPVYGMMLRMVDDRPDWTTSREHRFSAGTLLLTPVADYLLVASSMVDVDVHEAALRELARLG